MTEIDVATEIRRLADEIRAVADGGLRYAADLPYDAARYRHFRRIAAELMSLVDERDTDGIEREVFSALSHLAPIPAVSAAVFDHANRILLIRRSDNGHWEMPGGALDPGESPAEAARREAAEEAGVLVTPTELITVLDTRLEHSSPLQLVHIGFLCRYDGDIASGPARRTKSRRWSGSDRTSSPICGVTTPSASRRRSPSRPQPSRSGVRVSTLHQRLDQVPERS
jgi:8-oxo-dGTP pyrophosphatase MutT (NUDIX family)